MLAFLHVASGAVHLCATGDGYGAPDWQALPAQPGPGEWAWDAIAGSWQPDVDGAMARLRIERDRRLAACDFPQIVERPAAVRDAWVAYRQALRDLPETTTDPFEPEWPTPPAS